MTTYKYTNESPIHAVKAYDSMLVLINHDQWFHTIVDKFFQ